MILYLNEKPSQTLIHLNKTSEIMKNLKAFKRNHKKILQRRCLFKIIRKRSKPQKDQARKLLGRKTREKISLELDRPLIIDLILGKDRRALKNQLAKKRRGEIARKFRIQRSYPRLSRILKPLKIIHLVQFNL